MLIGSMKILFIPGTMGRGFYPRLFMKSSQAFSYTDMRKLEPQEFK